VLDDKTLAALQAIAKKSVDEVLSAERAPATSAARTTAAGPSRRDDAPTTPTSRVGENISPKPSTSGREATIEELKAHLALVQRHVLKTTEDRVMLKGIVAERLPGLDSVALEERLKMALAKCGVPHRVLKLCLLGEAPPPHDPNFAHKGTAGVCKVLAVPPTGQAMLFHAGKALLQEFGIQVAPFLTSYGAALRRQRQEVFDRLTAEGRNPRWRNGADLLYTEGGSDIFYAFV
jgi:hypothetical protein